MILYRENPLESYPPHKMLDLINISSKVSEYKTDTLSSLVFLYAGNKQSEKDP